MKNKWLSYLIEKEEYSIELFMTTLMELGFEVIVFSNPSKALKLLKERIRKPALIISDFQVEWEVLLSEARVTLPEPKIVFVVASVESASACRRAGCGNILARPFTQDEIKRSVCPALNL